MQEIIVWCIVCVALVYVLRNVLKQVSGLFGKQSDGCPGCGTCPAAKRAATPTDVNAKPKVSGTIISLEARKRS